jgi:hypothetical protein
MFFFRSLCNNTYDLRCAYNNYRDNNPCGYNSNL